MSPEPFAVASAFVVGAKKEKPTTKRGLESMKARRGHDDLEHLTTVLHEEEAPR
jgi:hypothetical protein